MPGEHEVRQITMPPGMARRYRMGVPR